MAMLTVNSGKEPTLQEAADLAGYKVADLDAEYGVVCVGQNTYVVRTVKTISWGGIPLQEYSDPVISPLNIQSKVTTVITGG